ncbi:MAG: hypothetical protein M0C28_13300 [Candidatus Moduliflexus flocculans]|nr:hypothetical protein [Candidatus Moduliflexus flocculans]
MTNIEATTPDESAAAGSTMTLEIRDLKHLEKVMQAIRKVPGVLEVEGRGGSVGPRPRARTGRLGTDCREPASTGRYARMPR